MIRHSSFCLSLVLVSGSLWVSGKDFDSVINGVSPEIDKWASVCIVERGETNPSFKWFHYRDSAKAVNFWPASTIKLYTVVAAFELLNELHMPLDSIVVFERNNGDDWLLDTARAMPEMVSEIFRRSSNEDYTLLLRMVGIDRVNTRFLIDSKGFQSSALMRGYVRNRPYLYVRTEPQRITVRTLTGEGKTIEHKWSGRSYSKERGATILSETTGNCTSTRELAECLRRVLFHEHLPVEDRYHLTSEQLTFLRKGREGLTGLMNPKGFVAESARQIFPNAIFYHKEGLISNYSLDLAYVDDSQQSGKRYIISIAANSGKETTVKAMSLAIASWVNGLR
tara:strand:- start:720 stop:1733 length:1014 start_codon:yes stop_codon:yes gene_type:complete